MSALFERYLEQVVNCPHIEMGKLASPCRAICRQRWVTLLGWGNPDASVAFVGLNPHYTEAAHEWHTPKVGISEIQHARSLATANGTAPRARHFWYHQKILRELSEQGVKVPKTIFDFAFFTEVAFCPTTSQAGLPSLAVNQCFDRNVRPFLLESQFVAIIALGRIPADLCVRWFLKVDPPKEFHGEKFEIPGTNKTLLTSYHPNAHGPWNRSVIADRLCELYRTGLIAFQ